MTSTRQLPSGPLPVYSEYNWRTQRGLVRFDKRLRPNTIDNQVFDFKGIGVAFAKSRHLTNAQLIDPWTLEGPTVPWFAFTFPPPRLDYTPPPYDVIGFDDSIALGFVDFPVFKPP